MSCSAAVGLTGLPDVEADVASVIGSGGGLQPLRRFILDRGPALLHAALHDVLPSEELPPALGPTHCRLIRAKVKPGHKITLYYDLQLRTHAPRRRVAVSWSARGAAVDPAAAGLEREARQRDVLAPFTRLRSVSRDGRRLILVAPLDPAFPQLIRLHDPRYLAQLLQPLHPYAPLHPDAAGSGIAVGTVRYRPGQRHVLRIAPAGSGPALYAKAYRDQTGERAVQHAREAGAALAAWGGPARAARPVAYVRTDRLALWADVAGRSLAGPVLTSPPLAALAGAALRALHTVPLRGQPRAVSPDAVGEARAVVRSAEHIEALLPAAGAQLRQLLDRAVAVLLELPTEPATFVHGDYKCDNLLVTGEQLHVIDFDRAAAGDPAVDLGKLSADLRWWSRGREASGAGLVETFLGGYGACDANRLARARCYDILFQLKAAARRLMLQDDGWPDDVRACVQEAGAVFAAMGR